MKTIGIIAEYNPFHYGHFYQLKKARSLTQSDCVIVLMSGNVVQRGEFPILDKWQRADLALQNGADLVLELPLKSSLQSADYFGSFAVEIMKHLKVDYLTFGTESAQLENLQAYLDFLESVDSDLQKEIRVRLKEGKAYPAAYHDAVNHELKKKNKKFNFNLSAGNHMLGLQYLKALEGSDIKPLVIPRLKASQELIKWVHLPYELQPISMLSGSQIRKEAQTGTLNPVNVPIMTWQKLQHSLVEWQDYYQLLNYAILVLGTEGLAKIQGMVEGMEFAIYKQNLRTHSWSDLVDSLTSTRWTRSAVQRLLMMVLLNIDQTTWQAYLDKSQDQQVIRILAFNQAGRQFLSGFESENIRLFSNLSKDIINSYHLTLRLDRVFQANPIKNIEEQVNGKHPIYLKKHYES
ncbi:tRNA(Met) cytidine acetate ligase [Facklamia miroungae]|uniref:tRNA(Met) cytidine acetate ligase n=1 Tax=Facklamia miroungae TaxID=120956 RepID=A0A1G7UI51_9LACT|nr:nucleotidyltransferase family protein [Facklamia miroungae]NKZ30093.1 nucleotidyltransferase family protein [Facklamia miroungae]SDG47226.1 Predicted nucleotidyltransferase [Facklamia miroungae]